MEVRLYEMFYGHDVIPDDVIIPLHCDTHTVGEIETARSHGDQVWWVDGDEGHSDVLMGDEKTIESIVTDRFPSADFVWYYKDYDVEDGEV